MKNIKTKLLSITFILFFNIFYCQQKIEYVKTSKNIKYEFEKWLTKSEFEKEETYVKRVKENSQIAFDSICNSIILKSIYQIREHNNLTLEVGDYNAEEEFFKIKIKMFDFQVGDTLNVKLSDAKKFKENSNNGYYSSPIIVISNSIMKWGFINNVLMPTIFDINIYENNYSKKLILDISNNLIDFKPLVFNTKELNIINKNFSELNFIFKDDNEEFQAGLYSDDNTVYNAAGIEVKPDFPGGMERFHEFISKNYNMPVEKGIQGKVYMTFVVEKDGSLTDIKVLRDIGYGTGAEAIRVLNKCPKWSPGKQNGKVVRCTYSLPISLKSAE